MTVALRKEHRTSVWCFAGALWLSASAAAAVELSNGRLELERTEAAADCPSEASFAAELSARQRGTRTADERVALHVVLDRDGDAFIAHIDVRGDRRGERTLRADGPSCGALHDALLVSLLLLLDENPASAEQQSLATPSAAAASRPPPAPSTRRVSLSLAAGAALTHGVPKDWSMAIDGDVLLRFGRTELALGGFWSPARQLVVAPGNVRVQLWGARLRACYAVLPSEGPAALRFSLCALGVASALSGEGRGFTSNDAIVRPLWLLGAGPEIGWPVRRQLEFALSANLAVPLHRESFSVEGLNQAYETDRVLGWVGAQVRVRIW